ncbi:hypothetical protein ACEYYB_13105 [Paracoccus sp. p4-l81]|uniref:hypothetical protein n=1 Tax=unclassified Paracoccus (in: a-proteobacteria) TaxID=2688777 RepID=UPI0035B81502
MLRSALICLMLTTGVAHAAADPSDPNWPCIQRKVPRLSVGALWTGPVPDAASDAAAKTPAVQALADRLALRRTPMDQAEAAIADFAQTADAATLTGLFQAVFDRIDTHRARLIDGIDRYAIGQQALATRLEQGRAQMSQLEAAAKPDFDAIDAAEKQLDWDTRIFDERRQSLTYVCETPVILEQRAYALSRAIAAHLPPP